MSVVFASGRIVVRAPVLVGCRTGASSDISTAVDAMSMNVGRTAAQHPPS